MLDSTPVEEEEEEVPSRDVHTHTHLEKTYKPISVKEHEIDFEV